MQGTNATYCVVTTSYPFLVAATRGPQQFELALLGPEQAAPLLELPGVQVVASAMGPHQIIFGVSPIKVRELLPELVLASLREVPYTPASAPAAEAVAVANNFERSIYHPTTGQLLKTAPQFPGQQYAGSNPDELPLWPRQDPSVIVLVLDETGQQVLLGRGQRRDYFSLVAGYVNPGEAAEQAAEREVLEETGIVVVPGRSRLLLTQPWPVTGSFMLGMVAVATSTQPQAATDGELAAVRWVTKQELAAGTVPLPPAGSLAHVLIAAWVAGNIDQHDARPLF